MRQFFLAKRAALAILTAACLAAAGCAAALPVDGYVAQNTVRYDQGKAVALGAFAYGPAKTAGVAPNWFSKWDSRAASSRLPPVTNTPAAWTPISKPAGEG